MSRSYEHQFPRNVTFNILFLEAYRTFFINIIIISVLVLILVSFMGCAGYLNNWSVHP